MENQKYISARRDRYGANAIPYISYIYLCELNNHTLYHNCGKDCKIYRNTIIHNFLINKTETCQDQDIKNKDICRGPNPISSICKEIYCKMNKPFPDVFYNTPIFIEIRTMYFDKFKTSTTETSTVIHVRMGDVYKKGRPNKQGFIGEENLIKLINVVYNKFNTPIFLMVAPHPRDVNICLNCLKKSNYNSDDYSKNILGSRNVDYDIFLMLSSKHLITSRSTFSFIPALLHKEIVYTYTDWAPYRWILGTDQKSEKFQILEY